MLMADVEAAAPAYILDTSPGEYDYGYAPLSAYPRLWSFVRDRYRVEAEVAGIRFHRLLAAER
jgi:hypothetical protein